MSSYPRGVGGRPLRNNVDLVLDLMNWSDYGPWGQMFIVEAIRKYSELTIEAEEWDESKFTIVSQELWKAIATDVKKRCDDFYNRQGIKPAEELKNAEPTDGQ